MIPILISEAAPISVILKILGIKLAIGIVAGFIVEFVISLRNKDKNTDNTISHLCEHEYCHCENGIVKSALKHTFNILLFIFVITLIINILIYVIGEDTISSFVLNRPVLGPILAGIIGLIPNCASSVILTELFLQNIISFATMIAGLLVSAGVGLIVLFRVNKNITENLKIALTLYCIGVISGILLGALGLNI